jgi:integrase
VTKLGPGSYCDRDQLYLLVTPNRRRFWFLRYISPTTGKRRDLGLGPVRLVSLAEAREHARTALRQVRELIDPLEARQAARASARADAARAITFQVAAEQYIAAHRAGWRNERHAAQWTSSLTAYAYPVIGALRVADIDTALVLKVLQPIWSEKTETASRVRSRIELVLDWAKVRGYRTGENPARWRGHLAMQFPSRARVQRVEHFAALPYAEIGAFMVALRAIEDLSARALEFVILTGAMRTGSAIGARWDEIDFDKRLWIVPAERMKMKKPHRVPLSEAAMALLRRMAAVRSSEFVFPGRKQGKSLGNSAMLELIGRMGRHREITVHGFRSTFMDWAAECTEFLPEVRKMALAHKVADEVEEAYRRGDLLEKRRQIMDDWAAFCGA